MCRKSKYNMDALVALRSGSVDGIERAREWRLSYVMQPMFVTPRCRRGLQGVHGVAHYCKHSLSPKMVLLCFALEKLVSLLIHRWCFRTNLDQSLTICSFVNNLIDTPI